MGRLRHIALGVGALVALTLVGTLGYMLVVAISKPDGETRFNPSPEEPLAQGDRLLAIGQLQSLKDLERRLA